MQTRYYSQPESSQPGDRPQDTTPGRPWFFMLLLAGIFFTTHPHHLDESVLFNYKAVAGDESEEARADTNATAVAAGSPERRIGLSLLGLAAIATLMTFEGPKLRINGTLGVLCVCFLALMFLSPLWSQVTFLAVRRVIAVGLLVLGAIAVARRFSIEDLMLTVVLATGSFLLIGILAEIYYGNFRPWVGGYRFGGTLHPNRQGMNCAMLALSAVAYSTQVTRGKQLLLATAVAAMLFLILTGSRTSLASACFGFIIFSLLWLPLADTLRYVTIVGTFGALLLGLGAMVAGDRLDEEVSSVLLLGRESDKSSAGSGSLTGRIPLWQECVDQLAERPWLGFGYKSFWTPQRILKISHHQGWSIMQAHNGYLEMALNVGLIGAGLFIAIILLSIKHALVLFTETKSVGAAFAVAVLCWLVLNTILESWIDEPLLPSFISLTLIVSLACLEQPLWQRSDLRLAAASTDSLRPKLHVNTPRLTRPTLVN